RTGKSWVSSASTGSTLARATCCTARRTRNRSGSRRRTGVFACATRTSSGCTRTCPSAPRCTSTSARWARRPSPPNSPRLRLRPPDLGRDSPMRPATVRRSALCALVLIPTIALAQQPATMGQQQGSSRNAPRAANQLRLEQYLDWEDVQDPQLSPDGRQVIYTRRWIDKLNDQWKTSLWITNIDGTKNRFLIDGSDARWSPDGSRITFIARGEPGGSQIFTRWMDAEGAVSQLTHVTESPSSLEWSPDGKWIAFSMLVPAKDDWNIA